MPVRVTRPKSTEEFVKQTVRQIQPGWERASFDIVDMYTKTPVERSCKAVIRRAKLNEVQMEERFGITAQTLERLLRECMTTYVQFADITVRQVQGWPMGGPASGAICEMYADDIVRLALSAVPGVEEFSRYVDDSHVVSHEGVTKRLLDELNGLADPGGYDSGLRWTVERPVNGRLPFLDAMLVERADGTILVEHYRKPTATNLYIPNDSAHPDAYKYAWIFAIAYRIETHVDEEARPQALRWLETAARSNGVPIATFKRKVDEAKRSAHHRWIKPGRKAWLSAANTWKVEIMADPVDEQLRVGFTRVRAYTKQHGWEFCDVRSARLRPVESEYEEPPAPWRKLDVGDDTWHAFVPKEYQARQREGAEARRRRCCRIPFQPAWHDAFPVLRKAGLRCVWTVRTLRDILRPTLKGRVEDGRTREERAEDTLQTGCVYVRACAASGCKALYIGETGKTLRRRQAQHDTAVRSAGPYAMSNALAYHSITTNHPIGRRCIAVVSGVRRKTQRLVLESLVVHVATSLGKVINNVSAADCPHALRVRPLSDIWRAWCDKPGRCRNVKRAIARMLDDAGGEVKFKDATERSIYQPLRTISERFKSAIIGRDGNVLVGNTEEGDQPKHRRVFTSSALRARARHGCPVSAYPRA